MAAVVFQELETKPGSKTWKRLLRRGGALVGLAGVLFFVLIALFAPWLAPHDRENEQIESSLRDIQLAVERFFRLPSHGREYARRALGCLYIRLAALGSASTAR
jgi:ABC-type dipeptide/oligopeptide/nickel transport system permease subunit